MTGVSQKLLSNLVGISKPHPKKKYEHSRQNGEAA